MSKSKCPKWACPQCGATPGHHGRGGRSSCDCHDPATCSGFICECDDWDSGPRHGSFADPCPNAHCYHCGQIGTYPKKPKGLQAWEQKALDAGWTMPTARAKELGL